MLDLVAGSFKNFKIQMLLDLVAVLLFVLDLTFSLFEFLISNVIRNGLSFEIKILSNLTVNYFELKKYKMLSNFQTKLSLSLFLLSNETSLCF